MQAHLDQLARHLHDGLPRLIDVQVQTLERFEPYRNVPPEQLLPSCTRNALRVVNALSQDSRFWPSHIEDEQESLRHRLQQGVSGDDALDGYRAVVRALRDEVLAQARSRAVPAEVLVVAIQRIWSLHDEMTSRMVSIRHKVELAMVARHHSGRATFFAQLLAGRLTQEELVEVGLRYDLHPSANYWFVLCADGADDVMALIEQEGHGDGRRALVGFHHGRVAGLLCRPLDQHPAFAHLSIACVGPYPAAESHKAANAGTDLLGASEAFQITGVVTEERLGLRLAVFRERAIGELLHRRFVSPLGTGAAARDMITTVRAFLESERSVMATADQIFVHANTVRYRLAKFCDLTGADLDCTRTLAELWWAFEYESIRADLELPSAE